MPLCLREFWIQVGAIFAEPAVFGKPPALRWRPHADAPLAVEPIAGFHGLTRE